MSFFSFHASPGFLMAKKMFIGSVFSTAAFLSLVGGIHFVLAQQDASTPESGSMNPPPDGSQPPMQGDRMPPPPPPGQPGQPDDRQGSPPYHSDQEQRSDFGGPNGRMENGGPQNGGQGEGLSEEDQKKMEARQKAQEERQKAQDAKNFKQMKQGMKQMSSMLKRVASRIASMKKSGIAIPENLQNSMDVVTKDLGVILGASSMDDEGVQDALSDLQESGSAIQDGMAELEQLAQAASLVKQADRQIKLLNTSLKRVQKIAKTSKVNVSSQADALAQAVNDITSAVQKAKDALASGDGQTAMQTLQDDVFEKLQDAYQYEALVRALQNMRSNISRFDSFIAKAKKTIAKMQKADTDVGDAPSELDQMSADLNKLKQMITQSDVDPGELSDLMNSLIDSQDSILEAMGQPSNTTSPVPSMNPNDVKDFQSFQSFTLPSFGGSSPSGGSSFGGPSFGGGGAGGGQMNPPIPMAPGGNP